MRGLLVGLILLPFMAQSMELSSDQFFSRISPVSIQGQIEQFVAPDAMCLSAADPTNLYQKYAPEISRIRAMLFADNTDSIPYQLGHFSCHNYSKRLFLQNSDQVTLLEPFNIPDMEREWTTTIKRSEDEKFEIYTVTLTSSEEGYFHAINAVLLDKENPQDINSYIFIEPQSDKIMLADELRAHSNRLMNKTMTAPIEVDIGTFDEYKFNGNIWQSFGSVRQKFTDRQF